MPNKDIEKIGDGAILGAAIGAGKRLCAALNYLHHAK
jgi:hypothetical protein